MPTKFVFEQLDEATREYLLRARAQQGKGMPGVFVKSQSAYPLLGCLLGPVLMIAVLMFTLMPDQIYNDPDGLALLQTAGLVLGGWMLLAAFRAWGSRNSSRVAGHWVYADPLHLYEAKAEQVTVTPMSGVTGVGAVHNLNNNAYQNSTVTLRTAEENRTLTIKDQRRADAMVQFYNYILWARGSEGGGRGNLPPAILGGLATYVAKNDHEPLEPNGNLNFNDLELDVESIPEEPQRTGHARPAFLVYPLIALAAVGCYFVMRDVNVPIRDDAIHKLVTTEPVQPVYLRQYLMDDRNTRHTEDIYRRLGPFYDKPLHHARLHANDEQLKAGMTALLESLKRAAQPVVSVRVTETKCPPEHVGGREGRVNALREHFVRQMTETLTSISQEGKPAINPLNSPAPPKMGEQLMIFTEAPQNTPAHIDVSYELAAADKQPRRLTTTSTMTLRDDVDSAQHWQGKVPSSLASPFSANEDARQAWATATANQLVVAVLGRPPGAPKVLNLPKMEMPKFQFPKLPAPKAPND